MKADHFYLCLFLNEHGMPCNRRTMKPLTMCSLHRCPKTGGRWPKTEGNPECVEDGPQHIATVLDRALANIVKKGA